MAYLDELFAELATQKAIYNLVFMEIIIILKGLLIGFCIALPVGPIGIMCVQQSLIRGMSYGLIAGLGAALADALYGALAGFGVSMSSEFLASNQIWFQLVGAVFLCFLGLRSFLSHPETFKDLEHGDSIQKIFASTFVLTLSNPVTLLCFAGIYAGLGIGLAGEGVLATLLLTFGVFTGSAVWWIAISLATSFLKNRISLNWVRKFNRISGAVLFSFGVAASLSVLQQILY